LFSSARKRFSSCMPAGNAHTMDLGAEPGHLEVNFSCLNMLFAQLPRGVLDVIAHSTLPTWSAKRTPESTILSGMQAEKGH
jgi:hypothetical protein